MHVICGGRQGCSEGLPLEDLAALGTGHGRGDEPSRPACLKPSSLHCESLPLFRGVLDERLAAAADRCQSRSSRRNGLVVCRCAIAMRWALGLLPVLDSLNTARHASALARSHKIDDICDTASRPQPEPQGGTAPLPGGGSLRHRRLSRQLLPLACCRTLLVTVR